jgi:hypothetical protein
MFTDKIELKDFDKMDAEYKDLLGRVPGPSSQIVRLAGRISMSTRCCRPHRPRLTN